MTKQEIQKEIAESKEEMKNVHGTPCTVWSRVVGYLRPVSSYNKGKIEEYKARKFYNVADGNEANKEANEAHYNLMSKMTEEKCFRCVR